MENATQISSVLVGRSAFTRGVTQADVDQAADSLLRSGSRPSTEKIRSITGGSPNTINPKLDAWWKRLASRIDAGPAALHRLPDPVVRLVEGLWLTLVDEARVRVKQENTRDPRNHSRESNELDVRAHTLKLREAELEDRLRERTELIDVLRTQLATVEKQFELTRADADGLRRRLAHQTRVVNEARTTPPGESKAQPKKRATTSKSRSTRTAKKVERRITQRTTVLRQPRRIARR